MTRRSTTRTLPQETARVTAERAAQRHQLRRALALAEASEKTAKRLQARLRVGGSLLDNVGSVQACDAAAEVSRALRAALAALEPS